MAVLADIIVANGVRPPVHPMMSLDWNLFLYAFIINKAKNGTFLEQMTFRHSHD